jgi:hypothetical protein
MTVVTALAWKRLDRAGIERSPTPCPSAGSTWPSGYRRLDERRYRYSSAGGRFVAELEIDEHGLVTTYGQIWARA